MPGDAFPYKRAFSIGVSFDLCFAPDESALLVVGRRLARWDLVSGKRTHSVAWSNGSGIDISPDGTRAVAMNTRGDAIMLDAASMEQLWVVRGREFGEGTAPVFAPDGSAFVTGSRRGDLVVRDAESGEVVLHEHGPWIADIACSPDRELFVLSRYAEPDGWLQSRRWPFPDHDPYEIALDAPAGAGTFVAADRIATSTRFHVAVYNARDGSLLEQRAVDGLGGSPLAWAPDGELFAVKRLDNEVVGLDSRTLAPSWSLELPYACAAAVSRSGAFLALGSWEDGVVASRAGVTTAHTRTPVGDDDTPAGTQARSDEQQGIIGYVEAEANEGVIEIDKVASKRTGAVRHEIWDVRCESSRWWAITEPLAAYDQEDHPHHNAALAFHRCAWASYLADHERTDDET